jgi:hypothetical protein
MYNIKILFATSISEIIFAFLYYYIPLPVLFHRWRRPIHSDDVCLVNICTMYILFTFPCTCCGGRPEGGCLYSMAVPARPAVPCRYNQRTILSPAPASLQRCCFDTCKPLYFTLFIPLDFVFMSSGTFHTSLSQKRA